MTLFAAYDRRKGKNPREWLNGIVAYRNTTMRKLDAAAARHTKAVDARRVKRDAERAAQRRGKQRGRK